MLYQSKYASLLVMVRSGTPIYHPLTGVKTGEVTPLHADFGVHSGEFMMEDPLTGQPERHALIYGHFWDSDEAAERLGWTPEEKESVEYTLDSLCKRQPYLIAKVEHQEQLPFTPDKPWPSYDETHHKTIPVLARQLGLVDQVIAYEQANANREGILKALTADDSSVEEVAEEMITL